MAKMQVFDELDPRNCKKTGKKCNDFTREMALSATHFLHNLLKMSKYY